ncbi:hypothetical protein [Aeromonas media]|uniref:hypothetical protein n=1 Tax=Aeromonas media TaxID=651 RepID=UPI003D1FC1BE
MNDTLLTAIISGVCLIAGAAIPTIIQRLDKKRADEAKNAQRRFMAALADIEYLYALVDEYKEEMKNTFGTAETHEMRKRVVEQRGLSWSGRFTPSRIANYRNRLEDI